MRFEGRKILSSEDIESLAARLLNHFNPQLLEYVRATPLLELTHFLEREHRIIFRFDDHLGFSDSGERILGAFNPKKRVVIVDASLKQDEHKFNFTLAHELGHLALHRSIKIFFDDEEAQEPSETVNEKIGNKGQLRTEAEWLEWQANYYASVLLMPQETIKAALILHQRQIGISRVGKIYVDNQRGNQLDYFRLLQMLSDFFKVSRTAVEIRLFKLGLIDDRRGAFSLKSILESYDF